MNGLNEIRTVYAEYLAAANLAEQNQKPTDGMFGIGKKAADDPCHTAFIDTLNAKISAFAEQKPASESVAAVLSYIYQMPLENRSPVSIYWMLIAAQGLTKELIPCLSPLDAAELYTAFCKNYRRWERLPVQNEICRALKQAAQ